MSFDQFNEDQVLNLDYADNNGRRQTGFSVDDRFDVDIHDLVVQRDSIGRIADTVARAAALGRNCLLRATACPALQGAFSSDATRPRRRCCRSPTEMARLGSGWPWIPWARRAWNSSTPPARSYRPSAAGVEHTYVIPDALLQRQLSPALVRRGRGVGRGAHEASRQVRRPRYEATARSRPGPAMRAGIALTPIGVRG